jgi:hypothetical protein
VRALLQDRVLPLVLAQQAAEHTQLAACVNCTGEFTYLACWPDPAAVEALEAYPSYQALLDELTPLLGVPPKRELWEILAEPAAHDCAVLGRRADARCSRPG